MPVLPHIHTAHQLAWHTHKHGCAWARVPCTSCQSPLWLMELLLWGLNHIIGASLVAQMVMNLPAMRETWVWSLGWGDPLEKETATTTTTKSLQLCPTLCDPTDGSPPGSPVPGILQARTLEWVAISFTNEKVNVKSLSRVRLLATPWTAAHQALPTMGFSRQKYWSGVPLPLQYYSGLENSMDCIVSWGHKESDMTERLSLSCHANNNS